MNLRTAASAVVVGLLASPIALGAQATHDHTSSTDCAKMASSSADHANMDHAAHMALMRKCQSALPTQPGQSAFGAISEIVRMLEADSTTDWSRVNIEALRQHLIDMDDVMMHAAVVQRTVPGGLEMEVTGTGRTAGAIKRMAMNHAKMLDQEGEYHATAKEIANGARITVTASDARTVARIRGLGFADLMTEGDHHAPHHLAIARGENPHGR
jgi:hypothetical protein